MDTEQSAAINTILQGHNVVLTGQAGTGKTFTIKQCVDKLIKLWKKVALTCYTGVACLQYQGLTPMTLHKFAGLEDGRHCNENLLHLLSTDERFSNTKQRILETDVLIIDEVSMVSKKVLESVEYLCRKLRGGNCFGGLHVILSGDFYQLPPIKDPLYGDDGSYCLKSHFFEGMFPHVVHLHTVHRQTETSMIKCVWELERGLPSRETNEFLANLSRPLNVENNINVVKLFARNADVDLYNYQTVMAAEGDIYIFESEDSGDERYLGKLLAPKRLGIKLKAPVMLLRNLNARHVNGLVGTVEAINKDCIEVKFEIFGKSEIVKITKFSFTKYDPVTNRCIASRLQYPLRLAYAMTIHKSQGMTLPLLEIDCSHANNPGQVGVAVGRAETSDGLRVLNYRPYLCKPHSMDINEFYDNYPVHTYVDELTCCRNHECVQTPLPTSAADESDSETDEANENIEHILVINDSDHTYSQGLNMGDSDHTYSKPSESDVHTVFKRAFNDFVDTPSETVARSALEDICNKKVYLASWYTDQCTKVQNIYKQRCTAEPGSLTQKHLTNFHADFQLYVDSEEYAQGLTPLTEHDFSRQILTSVMFLIQENVLKDNADTVNRPEHFGPSVLPSPDTSLSDPGRGKIRHVGGYCVAKIRYRLCKTMRSCFYVPAMVDEINKFQEQIRILDSMTSSASEITSDTIYKETLEETARKQNTAEGLTNITDSVFNFFLFLELEIRKLLTLKHLFEKTKHLFRYALAQLLTNDTLMEKLSHKCIDIDSSESSKTNKTGERHVAVIFEKIVRLFLSVTVAQFRKDYLSALKREKGMALRKKVLEKTSKKETSGPIDMTFIENDVSENKIISHFRLKALALQNDKFYSRFKKQDLTKLIHAYGKTVSQRLTKKDMGETLLQILKDGSSANVCSPESICPQEIRATDPIATDAQQDESLVRLSEATETISSDQVQINNQSVNESLTSDSPADEPIASTSTDQSTSLRKRPSASAHAVRCKKTKRCLSSKGKGKWKGKRSVERNVVEDDAAEACGVCMKFHVEGEEWICCDVCCIWYHRHCVGLDDEEWNFQLNMDAVYVCPMCV